MHNDNKCRAMMLAWALGQLALLALWCWTQQVIP
jgi:hypothetical protein